MTIGEIPQTFKSFKDDQPRWDAEIRFQVKDFISRTSFHKRYILPNPKQDQHDDGSS
jgi:hypothetical protein